MRQDHRASEKLFVDYAGQTVPVVDRETGEARQAQVFVAVLGASSYTFAEATWTQTLPDWTASHVRAFEFNGGCPELVVFDNLRSGVSLVAIADLLKRLNTRPFRKLPGSRRSQFEQLDRPALRPLPDSPTSSSSGRPCG